ncbi:SRPBCC domain-containing protein [Dactylosporangium sp. AC04546]|uniref:SRPBCC domain-containing protein n=1 Tax=Dactylosporangium sp. AC04546 TaxID=2862460 RepID=UPI001EE0BE3D|nr:SRPBCC domain-containing protein [Dactylosporangium sp. AC04546]WVK82938.1 SRPBCC domain-containing protein [Dactylosporangium sp. AC04546]
MTEIRVDVDLEHPPPAVWRALTEARLVTDWLPASRFMVRENGTFTFQAEGLEGLEDPVEGEVVTTEAPHRLVMRWEARNLHTVVALTIEERGSGSRLTLTQSGFLGPQGTLRRRVLRGTYTALFEGPLVATLAKGMPAEPGESGPPPVRRNEGGPFSRLPRQAGGTSRSAPGLSSEVRSTAGPRPTTSMPGFAAAALRARGVAAVTEPLQPPASPVRRLWARLMGIRDWSADRRSQAVAAAAAILLLIAMTALLIGKATMPHPADPPRVGGPTEGPAQATVPAVSTAPSIRATAEPVVPATSRSTSPTPGATSVTPTAPPQLTAAYRSEDLQLTSYRVTITIANPGPATATNWTVVVTLPILDLTVRNVKGAVMTRADVRAIFTPAEATRTVRAGGSVTLSFEVEGLGARNEPTNCTIDGRSCAATP